MNKLATTYGTAIMRVVELALSVAIAAALCYTVQGGFNISESVHQAVWLNVLVCLALQGILLAGAFSTRGKVAWFVGYGVIALGACIVAIVAAPSGNPIADVPQNLFVTATIFGIVNVLVFILARRHLTCLVLFGLGAFLCGYTQFLYTTNMLVATVVFLLAAGMLIAFRAYAETVQMTSNSSHPLLGKAGVTGTLLPVAACALAALVVIGLIMPLNPPHASIKLFNEYLSYEEEQVKTAVELDQNAEKTLTSSIIDEDLEPRTTTDMKIDNTAPQQTDPDNAQHDEAKNYLSGDYSDVDLSALIDNMRSLAFDTPIPVWLVVLGALALAIVLLIVPRIIVHSVRLRRIASKHPREQITSLYRFFLTRFKKLGYEKPAALSPVEYANLFRSRLAPYVGAQEAGSFDHLTALLVQQQYAEDEPEADDLQCMYWMYRMFYKRCRKELGLFKYTFKHLTL